MAKFHASFTSKNFRAINNAIAFESNQCYIITASQRLGLRFL